MRRVILNNDETKEYNSKVVNVIPRLLPGTYYVRDFFKGQATPARIARKFYEDVNDGIFHRVTLAANFSREGYVIQ